MFVIEHSRNFLFNNFMEIHMNSMTPLVSLIETEINRILKERDSSVDIFRSQPHSIRRSDPLSYLELNRKLKDDKLVTILGFDHEFVERCDHCNIQIRPFEMTDALMSIVTQTYLCSNCLISHLKEKDC